MSANSSRPRPAARARTRLSGAEKLPKMRALSVHITRIVTVSAMAIAPAKSMTGRRPDTCPGRHFRKDVVRNPGMVSFVIDIGDPAVLQIGSIIWIVRDSQSTREELVGIRHIAERQCDGSFKRRR